MFHFCYICFMNDKKFIQFDYKGFAEEFKKTLTYGDSMRKISKEIGVSPPTVHRALRGDNIDLITALRIACKMKRDLKDFTYKKS